MPSQHHHRLIHGDLSVDEPRFNVPRKFRRRRKALQVEQTVGMVYRCPPRPSNFRRRSRAIQCEVKWPCIRQILADSGHGFGYLGARSDYRPTAVWPLTCLGPKRTSCNCFLRRTKGPPRCASVILTSTPDARLGRTTQCRHCDPRQSFSAYTRQAPARSRFEYALAGTTAWRKVCGKPHPLFACGRRTMNRARNGGPHEAARDPLR